ncbi:olfactory receptor 11A1-like [Mantella aurantiaca]
MSYDRYLAVCNPLHYTRIMNAMLQQYITFVWISSFVLIFLPIVLFPQLSFCGPNVIDHFFCDLAPVLALSCSDTFIIKMEALVFSICVMFLFFFLIISSYVRILLTILRIPSTRGRQKTFSTCSAHLFAVCTYFLSIISIYCDPSSIHPTKINRLQSLVYIVVPPLFNPIIYTLKNKEIQFALQKLRSALKTQFFRS